MVNVQYQDHNKHINNVQYIQKQTGIKVDKNKSKLVLSQNLM